MERRARGSVLLYVALMTATIAAQSGQDETSGSGDQTDQSDSPLSLIAVIGICVGGGVVLLSCVMATTVCVVCCIWRKKRQKSARHYDPEVHLPHPNGGQTASLRSFSSNSLTHKLLNTTMTKEKKIPVTARDSDLRVTPSANSNPLYNSSSIAYFTSQTPQEPSQKETPLSVDPPPLISVSPRRHSLGYVEMQSAGPALTGISTSHSVGDFTDSFSYASVRQTTGVTIPSASASFSPPPSSFLTSTLPASHGLQTLNPPHPAHYSPSHQKPSTHPPRQKQHQKRETTDKPVDEGETEGGEEDYVDPKLFLEDQEKILQEDIIMTETNRAYLDSFSNSVNQGSSLPSTTHNHTSFDPTHQTHPETVPSNSNPAQQPSYQNIDPESAYISDSYEQVNEFLGDAIDERALLLATGGDQERSSSPGQPETRQPGSQVQPSPGRTPARHNPAQSRSTGSLDRTLSLDNQYVEVVSPSRKAKSMKAQSKSVDCQVDPGSPELDYQNVVPGMETWGNGNRTRSAEDLHVVKELPKRGQRSSPGQQIKKSPSPTPRGKTSPKPQVKPKPKPHPSKVPPRVAEKPRSKSSDAIAHTSTQQQMLIVAVGNGTDKHRRPHLEEFIIPSTPGNDVVATSNGGVVNNDTRWRSATVPVAKEAMENGEDLYINLREEDTENEELYQNITITS